ncbi:long-chain fatty acid transport protein 4-like [Copidosoma floridanum]|uniref:long-chain fatty acid transport protein 4-like n=1 Tax=Copidosoma floridanum TaxID=29053 RepID=UPI0006C951B3|nr:long-chain fatty acid transport protein 4-like [Copidosoma floridanum]XP_014205069.1 long-chain fatty acid transport protein 4-like [Copidosoma floridanum]XP_014205070.1 long-chain fatty acid transport protein 4-like [Copidosoma floridanum]XP_014205071.1 long-chain fatty acid transport protein 4-like [Copidosoma floridanum]XP_014205072.1 long-chain fatty acid transport protein 4-like [Copidosoma floridanum]XP_014205073.1 long-chain fatty acid transport protein 4-like [Copidosoma floridanum]
MEVRLALLVLAVVGSLMAASLSSRFGLVARIVQLGLAAAVVPLVWTYHRKLYIIIRTLPRDIKFLYRYVNAHRETKQYARNNTTVMKLFRERARQHPEKPCFIFEDQTWTNADIDKYSNRIASVFKNAGFVKGDAVALLMFNKPEYVATWLGLGKLGVITALINTNLRQKSLAHCLTVAKVKAIIFADELTSAIDEILESLPNIQRYRQGSDAPCTGGTINLNEIMSKASDEQPLIDQEPGYKDNLLYIYTSGTTGLPKAAQFPNSRYLLVQTATYHMLGLRNNDIVYNPIPLYHMSGGIVGTVCALTKGIPSVLRTKFSVSAYWTDCIKYNCTITQYIGEMCRYLLSAPARPEDSAHKVRLMVGNGMRPQIWQSFVNRFKIEQVNEVYGSSEGNANIVNVDNTVGAVGFVPSILPKSLHPVAIIRVNPENCEPIRDSRGFCIRAQPNEPGMFIGLIKQGDAAREFNGYLDKEASKKKTIENVFIKGDKAFLTGDILVQDVYGYFYFKDRTGDTFRWKGENVATAEVEGVVSNVAGYRDTTVYGVQVPGMEGRAGMAAIVDPESLLDFKALAEGLDKALPSYARPIFLRIVKELELTGTFKLKKINLQKEGFDPNKIQDKVYFRSGNKEYVEVTPEIYEEIISGAAKL